jgi:hypothetical protein
LKKTNFFDRFKDAQEIFVGDIMPYSGEIQLNSPLNEKVVYKDFGAFRKYK